MKAYYINNFFIILTLVPCFVAIPFIGVELFESYQTGQPIVWTEQFTLLVVCSILGAIAGLGILLQNKVAKIITLVIFISGMVIWLVLFFLEYARTSYPHAQLLSAALFIYTVCISILLLLNRDLMLVGLDENFFQSDDILDK